MTIGRGSNRIYTNQGQALKSQSNIRSGLGLPVCLPDVEMDVGVEDRSRYRQHLSAYLGSYLRNFTNRLNRPAVPGVVDVVMSWESWQHGDSGIPESWNPRTLGIEISNGLLLESFPPLFMLPDPADYKQATWLVTWYTTKINGQTEWITQEPNLLYQCFPFL